jgi:hypothetical protein
VIRKAKEGGPASGRSGLKFETIKLGKGGEYYISQT